MLILVIYSRPKMRTMKNVFIFNLAVADLLVVLFCVHATLVTNLFIRKFYANWKFSVYSIYLAWVFGSVVCKVFFLCTIVSLLITSLIPMAYYI